MSEYSVLVQFARAGASLEGVTVGGDRSRFQASKRPVLGMEWACGGRERLTRMRRKRGTLHLSNNNRPRGPLRSRCTCSKQR